jgi:uncharacterized protein (DUF2235 family)
MPKKRLIVCCDGTWNTPDEVRDGRPCPTNVTRLARAIVTPAGGDGVEQRVYYHKGVGTGAFDHFRGGALGWGLSRNVQDAYMFLVDNHDDPGDEIFLFGFSRGAYTARSVAGLVRNAGLLRRRNAGKLHDAYELYRDRSEATHPRSIEAELFRKSFSIEVRIKFIGVWDTVGALGVPVDFPGVHLVNDRWKFHDVKLSTYVDRAFQALALDERRKPFTPAIWQQQPLPPGVRQTLEQVWFAGVHSDVGGGYPESGLADVALGWMAKKAADAGVALDPGKLGIPPSGPDPMAPTHDSMTWYYRLFGELVRAIPVQRCDADGRPVVTNEKAASAAVDRLRDPSYRPPNLIGFIDAGGAVAPT